MTLRSVIKTADNILIFHVEIFVRITLNGAFMHILFDVIKEERFNSDIFTCVSRISCTLLLSSFRKVAKTVH